MPVLRLSSEASVNVCAFVCVVRLPAQKVRVSQAAAADSSGAASPARTVKSVSAWREHEHFLLSLLHHWFFLAQ